MVSIFPHYALRYHGLYDIPRLASHKDVTFTRIYLELASLNRSGRKREITLGEGAGNTCGSLERTNRMFCNVYLFVSLRGLKKMNFFSPMNSPLREAMQPHDS